MKDVEEYDPKAEWTAQFESLRPDLYLPDSMNAETKEKIVSEVRGRKIKTSMFASIPIICRGPECVFASTCGLQKQGIAPVSNPCPYEMAIVQQFMAEYMAELDVDPNNLVEVSMIRDLVDQEVQYLRKTKLLSQEHFIQENVVGVDSEGRVIMKKELHMAVELEDRLHRRKRDLRNQLLATREARAKVGQSQGDPAQTIAKILEDVNRINYENQKALDEKLGLFHDAYIDAEVVDDEDE